MSRLAPLPYNTMEVNFDQLHVSFDGAEPLALKDNQRTFTQLSRKKRDLIAKREEELERVTKITNSRRSGRTSRMDAAELARCQDTVRSHTEFIGEIDVLIRDLNSPPLDASPGTNTTFYDDTTVSHRP